MILKTRWLIHLTSLETQTQGSSRPWLSASIRRLAFGSTDRTRLSFTHVLWLHPRSEGVSEFERGVGRGVRQASERALRSYELRLYNDRQRLAEENELVQRERQLTAQRASLVQWEDDLSQREERLDGELRDRLQSFLGEVEGWGLRPYSCREWPLASNP